MIKKVKLVFYMAVLLALTAISVNSAEESRVVKVVFVYDGDTILVKGNEKVRFLGIDTPEMHYGNDDPPECFAFQSKNYVFNRIRGKQVKLTFDDENKDKYGRTLAWVWYGENFDKLLNAEIVGEGYGRVFRKYVTSKTEMLKRMELKARKLGLGMWAPGAC